MKKTEFTEHDIKILKEAAANYSTLSKKEKTAEISRLTEKLNTNGIDRFKVSGFLREESNSKIKIRQIDDIAFPKKCFNYKSRDYKFKYSYNANGRETRHYMCSNCNALLKVTLYDDKNPQIDEKKHSDDCPEIIFSEITDIQKKKAALLTEILEYALKYKITNKIHLRNYIDSQDGKSTAILSDTEIESISRQVRNKIPSKSDELMKSDYSKYNGMQFVQSVIKYPNSTMIVFGFDSSFKEKNGDVLLVDATFKIVPKSDQYSQLLNFMIHVRDADFYLPVLHILMKGKDEASYNLALSVASQYMSLDGFEFISCDFELALLNSLKKCCHTGVFGCYFHYCQCLKRKFVELYKVPDTIQWKAYQVYRIIPFLDKGSFEAVVNFMEANSEKFAAFANYYNSQWKMRYDIIERFSMPVDIFTNDALESYHKLINSHIAAYGHPSIGEACHILEIVDHAKLSELIARRINCDNRGKRIGWRRTVENVQNTLDMFCDACGLNHFIIDADVCTAKLKQKYGMNEEIDSLNFSVEMDEDENPCDGIKGESNENMVEIMGFSQDFPFDRKKSLGNSENSVNDKIIKLFSRKNRISLLIPRK